MRKSWEDMAVSAEDRQWRHVNLAMKDVGWLKVQVTKLF